MMKRYYIVFKGRVQGVGFRWRLYNLAEKYRMTGYARNLRNGDVEAAIQGEQVDEFLKEALAPDYYIRIDDYAIKELKTVPEETEFRVRY